MTREVRWGYALAVCLLAVPLGLAEVRQIAREYTFERPSVSAVTLDGQVYDRVTMSGVANGGNVGAPALPVSGARLLLPYGTEVIRVQVVPTERVSLGTDYLVEPRIPGVPLGNMPSQAPLVLPDTSIYAGDRAYPEAAGVTVGVHGFRGYQILVVRLEPVQWVPATGELVYFPRLRVEVELAATGRASDLLRGLPNDKADVLAKVDNPEILDTYAAAGVRAARNYDMLILTTPALAAAFQPLKAYHDSTGTPTEIRTTTDIGSTDPDLVRDYIRQEYLANGISYVLIGGDDDVVPAKDLYVQSDNSSWPTIEYDVPGDVYFICLDGTWNHDGDSYWGEPTDGAGGGDVDLIAELYVGRACVGTTAEVDRFVNKTLWYLTGQHSQPWKVLLVGEHLGFGGVSEYAADTLEELIDGSDHNGFVTVGIPTAEYTIDELFERDWPGHDWPQSELVSRINAGVHFLNHLGHGSPTSAMKLDTGDLTSQLTNTDLCLVYSQTCLAGHFDGNECWAETAHIKTDHGAFAVVMNAREGWGEFNSTDGASQRFDREFWDAVFNPEEDLPEIGRANQDSKEDNLYRISDDYMRWIYYELNVFGDPTLALSQVSGVRVRPATGLQASGNPGGPFTPASLTYTLENLSDSGVEYEVTHAAPWLSVTNPTGYLAGGAVAEVTVTLNDNARVLGNGFFEDALTFTNATTHEGDTTRSVSLTIGVPGPVYSYNLDTHPGWMSAGEWAFGPPTGQGGGAHGFADPTGGATGSNVFGVNLDGDYATTAGGPYYVLVGPLNLSSLSEVSLHFQRWLNTDYQPYVYATVEVSPNGSQWTTLWQNGHQPITDASWQAMALSAPLADHKPTVFFRFGYRIGNGAFAYSGWNIDDIQIWGRAPTQAVAGACCLPDGTCQVALPAECSGTFMGLGVMCLTDTCQPAVCAGDSNCDGAINWHDIDYFVAAMNDNVAAWEAMFTPDLPTCQFANNDVNSDGTVNWRDIDALVALMNTTCP